MSISELFEIKAISLSLSLARRISFVIKEIKQSFKIHNLSDDSRNWQEVNFTSVDAANQIKPGGQTL